MSLVTEPVFIAISNTRSGNNIRSTDGINWSTFNTNVGLPGSNDFQKYIAFAPELNNNQGRLVIAAGNSFSSTNNSNNSVNYSDDGITWIDVSSNVPAYGSAYNAGGIVWSSLLGKFLVAPSQPQLADWYESEDGINWSRVSVPYSGSNLTGLTVVKGGPQDGAICLSDPNGVWWTYDLSGWNRTIVAGSVSASPGQPVWSELYQRYILFRRSTCGGAECPIEYNSTPSLEQNFVVHEPNRSPKASFTKPRLWVESVDLGIVVGYNADTTAISAPPFREGPIWVKDFPSSLNSDWEMLSDVNFSTSTARALAIAYSKKLRRFVVCGSSGVVRYSDDGRNWLSPGAVPSVNPIQMIYTEAAVEEPISRRMMSDLDMNSCRILSGQHSFNQTFFPDDFDSSAVTLSDLENGSVLIDRLVARLKAQGYNPTGGN